MSVLFTRRGEPPILGKRASDYAVGESVFLTISGTPTEFLIVHQGNPDESIYDASCDGIWLIAKEIYENKAWDSDYNNYAESDIHAYLNGEFLSSLNTSIQNAIKQVKIPYKSGVGSFSSGVLTGENGLSTKVFLLSGYEVGLTYSASDSQLKHLPIGEGAKLSYFNEGIDTTAFTKRFAYYNGELSLWWLRSPSTSTTDNVWHIKTNGGHTVLNGASSFSYGIRPAFILPSDIEFNPNTNAIL